MGGRFGFHEARHRRLRVEGVPQGHTAKPPGRPPPGSTCPRVWARPRAAGTCRPVRGQRGAPTAARAGGAAATRGSQGKARLVGSPPLSSREVRSPSRRPGGAHGEGLGRSASHLCAGPPPGVGRGAGGPGSSRSEGLTVSHRVPPPLPNLDGFSVTQGLIPNS